MFKTTLTQSTTKSAVVVGSTSLTKSWLSCLTDMALYSLTRTLSPSKINNNNNNNNNMNNNSDMVIENDQNDHDDPVDFNFALDLPSAGSAAHGEAEGQDLLEILNESILWALPKRKTTPARKRRRNTNKWLSPITNITTCLSCGAPRLLHTLCINCFQKTQKTVALNRALKDTEKQLEKLTQFRARFNEGHYRYEIASEQPLGIPSFANKTAKAFENKTPEWTGQLASISNEIKPKTQTAAGSEGGKVDSEAVNENENENENEASDSQNETEKGKGKGKGEGKWGSW